MAGLYIHVPFCISRCIYCDFYSSTEASLKDAYIHALCRELQERTPYIKGEHLNTIYFGGGTPSTLSGKDFEQIFRTLTDTYPINPACEITLEANPDDLTTRYLQELKSLPFNRISIGIQTFQDNMLKRLNRRHTGSEAIQAIESVRKAGFNNISIDLMYGLPGQSVADWEADLQQAVALNVEHISAYHLTYEEGTPIYKMLQKHQIEEVGEDKSVLFFEMLIGKLKEAGYEHYEISNFCRPDMYSKHNAAYWDGSLYLGCGPSAHSYNGEEREWNIDSIRQYIEGINTGKRYFEKEELDKTTRYNDLIITSLRTSKGISLAKIESEFGDPYFTYCLQTARQHLNNHELELKDHHLKLTTEGIFVSDGVMRNLLYIEEATNGND